MYNTESWKAAMILSGSIIEALLIDFLSSSTELDKARLLKFDLNQAIAYCFENNFISEKAKNLSDVIRNYRNLIHPGRSIRTNEIPSKEDAVISLSLVEIILNELIEIKEKKYGYTAEQILEKVVNDSSSISIWGHLTKK